MRPKFSRRKVVHMEDKPPSQPKITLVVMRLANMHQIHPDQIEDICDQCSHAVGVFPSGQSVIALQSRPRVHLLCDVCFGRMPVAKTLVTAPGALEERAQTKPRGDKK